MSSTIRESPTLRVQQLGVMCEGSPTPGPTQNVAFPYLFRCADNSLLLGHRVGQVKNSARSEIWLWRSRDDGKSRARVPYVCRNPAGNFADFRTAALSDIGQGRIAILLTWIDHPDDSPLLVNEKTEGLLPVYIGWAISSDHGQTWSALREIDVSPLVQPAGNSPVLRLNSGELLVAFETYKYFDDPSPWSANAAISISRDDGKTWNSQNIAADPAHQISYFDPHVYLTEDGSLLALMWADDRRRAGASEIQWSRSTDAGRSWSTPQSTGLQGQYSTAMKCPDGRWLMLYVVRHGDSAIRIALGDGQPIVWKSRDGAVLYSQRASDLTAAKDQDFSDYLQNMGKWTFGWPAQVALGGDVLAAYYAGAGDRSSVHLARITF